MKLKRSLKWLAVLTTIGMFFVLIGGALVTKTESELGCGRSWPLCHGELIPSEITFELVVELSHRLVSASLGIMVLVLAIWAWRAIGHIRETKFLAIMSVLFIIIQGLLGAAAVVWAHNDYILAAHFGISLISFASIFLLTLLIFEVDKKFAADRLIIDKRMAFHIVGLVIYIFLVVYTGALVRHVEASLVCPDWPLCINGSFSLPGNLHEWVQVIHRAAAGLLFIWIAYATYLAIRYYRHQKVVYWSWIASFILILLQVLSGAMIIFTGLNLYVALSHAFFISSLFGVISYLLLLVSRNKKNVMVQGKHNVNKQL